MMGTVVLIMIALTVFAVSTILWIGKHAGNAFTGREEPREWLDASFWTATVSLVILCILMLSTLYW